MSDTLRDPNGQVFERVQPRETTEVVALMTGQAPPATPVPRPEDRRRRAAK